MIKGASPAVSGGLADNESDARRLRHRLQHHDGAPPRRRRRSSWSRSSCSGRPPPTCAAGSRASNAALPPTRAFAREPARQSRETPATIAAAEPWLAQATALFSQQELGGLLDDLTPATKTWRARPRTEPRWLPRVDDFNRCVTEVIDPDRQHQGRRRRVLGRRRELQGVLVRSWSARPARARASTATARSCAPPAPGGATPVDERQDQLLDLEPLLANATLAAAAHPPRLPATGRRRCSVRCPATRTPFRTSTAPPRSGRRTARARARAAPDPRLGPRRSPRRCRAPRSSSPTLSRARPAVEGEPVKRAALMRALRANAVAAGALIGIVLLGFAGRRLHPRQPAPEPACLGAGRRRGVLLQAARGARHGPGRPARPGPGGERLRRQGRRHRQRRPRRRQGDRDAATSRSSFARVYPDATILLRPKTGLKDMVVELDPGTPVVRRSARRAARWSRTARRRPDVNFDEFLASLDGDTQDYLKLLLGDAGRRSATAAAAISPTPSAASSRSRATSAKAIAARRQAAGEAASA